MPNYQLGKIYSIRSHMTEMIYIGSTCNTLSRRMANHKDTMKRWKSGVGAKTTSYDILEYGDAYIELIEEYPCNSKILLEKREGEIMRATENTVNRITVGRTKAEYYIDNADKLKQKNICLCGGRYTFGNLPRHYKSIRHQAYERFIKMTEEELRTMLNNL
jgi:hypothetical protein